MLNEALPGFVLFAHAGWPFTMTTLKGGGCGWQKLSQQCQGCVSPDFLPEAGKAFSLPSEFAPLHTITVNSLYRCYTFEAVSAQALGLSWVSDTTDPILYRGLTTQPYCRAPLLLQTAAVVASPSTRVFKKSAPTSLRGGNDLQLHWISQETQAVAPVMAVCEAAQLPAPRRGSPLPSRDTLPSPGSRLRHCKVWFSCLLPTSWCIVRFCILIWIWA